MKNRKRTEQNDGKNALNQVIGIHLSLSFFPVQYKKFGNHKSNIENIPINEGTVIHSNKSLFSQVRFEKLFSFKVHSILFWNYCSLSMDFIVHCISSNIIRHLRKEKKSYFQNFRFSKNLVKYKSFEMYSMDTGGNFAEWIC